ncbi:uncharacterized protein C8Q71DRAFT_722259 [Rhodofomes roseus]|uniref:DUF6532 domain-containing protein n=1 Tax=Rhodofomes roseus TaxID=34475 RepID=A0ABQ8KN98_9APHY|nr:uncharacterized protein C8Q71DRAFT_722259 [Rhodofomes roseus]KAH9839286.1 hypothetical protein C8Q71DRAFT_722259 [Rhodofomes roseus]
MPSADEIEDIEELPSENEKPRRYATRATNDPHPGRTSGLAKKTQAEISRDAKRKRDDKKAEYLRKEAELEQRRLEMNEHMKKLAELERDLKASRGKTTMEKLLEDEEMLEVDAVEDRDVMAQMSSKSDEGEDADVEDRELQSFCNTDEDASSQSADGASSDDRVPTGAKRKSSGLKAPKQKKKKKTAKEVRDGVLADVEKAKKKLSAPEVAEQSSTRRSKATSKSTAKSTPTSTSKSKSTGAATAKSSTSSSRATSISVEPIMGLKADWQSAVSRRSQTPAAKSQAGPSMRVGSPAVPSSSQGTPAPKNSAAAHRAANAKRTRRTNSIEYIGGFTDDDVTVSLPTARRGSTQLAQVVSSRERDESEEQDAEPEGTKKKRRAKGTVSEEKSLAVNSLPLFIRPHWKTVYLPTMLQLIGETEHPWVYARGKTSSNGDDNLLITLVQKLLDSFWPKEHYNVTGRDKIFKIARQAVIDWRGRFATRIKTAVKQELTKRGSAANIRAFVESALSRSTGLAFWATYDADTDTASGALQSPYVLKSFATHLAAIQGSRIKPHETKPARGALALAATAVQYVFATWKTGALNKALSFSGDTYGPVTEYWHTKSVAKMIARGKYNRCVDLATPHIEASWMPRTVDDDDDISVCDPETDPEDNVR